MKTISEDKIAVIGFACRFPNSPDIQSFWNNLKNGTDCISTTKVEKNEHTINRYGVFEGYLDFDPDYFGINKTEADLMDPQQRWMLELCAQALEHSGVITSEHNPIGIYAGTEEFLYVWQNIFSTGRMAGEESYLHKSYLDGSLASRTAYLMNLTGPSVTMKASCATSLYCVHYACEELRRGGCEVALAAGVNLHEYQDRYQPADGTLSKSGVVRPFDEEADGFIPGNGIGVVVLKKLDKAVRDGDKIYSVVCGSAVCNDGRQKLGFSAPSVNGEYRAVKNALKYAGVRSGEIEYVETHGTATDLGDTIEIKALSKALNTCERNHALEIGSVKSNIGHLNAAAGIASFIKTCLMLYNREMVPTINFRKPNPKLELEKNRIHVCTDTRKWNGEKLYAGVSAFGIGGNNCHMILSSYEPKVRKESGRLNIYPVSAQSKTLLEDYQTKILQYENRYNMDSAAYTLQCCRTAYNVRTAVLASDYEELSEKLKKNRHFTELRENDFSDSVFLFAGASAVSWSMISELYRNNGCLRPYFDECFAIIDEIANYNLKEQTGNPDIPEKLENIMIFCLEYAIASYYTELGVCPDMVCGYSAGEYMAAYFAGVFTLRELFEINLQRIEAMEDIPESRMMTIMDSAENVEALLTGTLEISAYNAKNRIMVSGMKEDIEKLSHILEKRNVMHVILPIKRAGHFSGVRNAASRLEQKLEQVDWHKPDIPVISSYLGKVAEDGEICSKEYWLNEMICPVRFSEVLEQLNNMDSPKIVFVGVNAQLSRFYNQMKKKTNIPAVCVLPEHLKDVSQRLTAGIADAWSIGLDIDFSRLWNGNPGKEDMPTLAFENKRYRQSFSLERQETDRTIPSLRKLALVNGLSSQMKELTNFLMKSCEEVVVIQEKKVQKTLPDMTEVTGTLKEIEIRMNEKYPECKTIQDYEGLDEAYNQLCLAAGAGFLRTFSVLEKVNETTTFEDVRRRCAVSEDYYEMFRLILRILREYGYIKADDLDEDSSQITVLKSLTGIPSVEEMLETYKEKYSEFMPYMKLLKRCSDHYPGVLTGKVSGKSVIYPKGEYHLLDKVYSDIPVTTKTGVYAEIMGEWIASIAKSQKRKIKILEVGAGTGIVTWLAMKALAEYEVEYYFTDIGKSFLETARSKAGEKGYTNMIFKQLDVTRPFDIQNVPHNYFDIVVSCNVIQSVTDMDNALKNMRKALIKNGILALLQTVSGNRISEMIFGLCPEWWNYRQDESRKDSPIIDTTQWEQLLLRNGYRNIRILNGDEQHLSDMAIATGQICDDQTLLLSDEEIRNLNDIQMNKDIRIIFCDSYKKKDIDMVIPTGYEVYLPEKWKKQYEKESAFDFCRNETDIKLVELLYQITGVMVEDLTETLYGMAIDSLSALIICTKIGEIFDIPFGIAQLLQFSCIEELSDYIDRQKTNEIIEQLNFEEEF